MSIPFFSFLKLFLKLKKQFFQGANGAVPGSRQERLHSKSSLEKISDGPSDLSAAEAAGARINVRRGTVDDGLDALDIGLPSPVGATVRMADLDAESDTLVTEFTLCQTCCTSSSMMFRPPVPGGQLIYHSRVSA